MEFNRGQIIRVKGEFDNDTDALDGEECIVGSVRDNKLDIIRFIGNDESRLVNSIFSTWWIHKRQATII